MTTLPSIRPALGHTLHPKGEAGCYHRRVDGTWYGARGAEKSLTKEHQLHLESIFQKLMAEGTCITAVKQQDGSTIYTKSWREV